VEPFVLGQIGLRVLSGLLTDKLARSKLPTKIDSAGTWPRRPQASSRKKSSSSTHVRRAFNCMILTALQVIRICP
jgi:hypothetical protein